MTDSLLTCDGFPVLFSYSDFAEWLTANRHDDTIIEAFAQYIVYAALGISADYNAPVEYRGTEVCVCAPAIPALCERCADSHYICIAAVAPKDIMRLDDWTFLIKTPHALKPHETRYNAIKDTVDKQLTEQ